MGGGRRLLPNELLAEVAHFSIDNYLDCFAYDALLYTSSATALAKHSMLLGAYGVYLAREHTKRARAMMAKGKKPVRMYVCVLCPGPQPAFESQAELAQHICQVHFHFLLQLTLQFLFFYLRYVAAFWVRLLYFPINFTSSTILLPWWAMFTFLSLFRQLLRRALCCLTRPALGPAQVEPARTETPSDPPSTPIVQTETDSTETDSDDLR